MFFKKLSLGIKAGIFFVAAYLFITGLFIFLYKFAGDSFGWGEVFTLAITSFFASPIIAILFPFIENVLGINSRYEQIFLVIFTAIIYFFYGLIIGGLIKKFGKK